MFNVSSNKYNARAIEEIQKVLGSGVLTRGKYSKQLEVALKEYTQSENLYCVSSGTASLHVALLAAGVGVGDEVIVPSLTYISSASSIMIAGATPIFADVELDTFCIDVEDVERKITKNTKAVIAVDFAGLPCDYKTLSEICRRNNVKLICDAAHSFGCYSNSDEINRYYDYICYSFYPTKPLGTSEGGALVVNDHRADLEYVDSLINNGLRSSKDPDQLYDCHDIGFKYNLNEISSVIALSELEFVRQKIEVRKRLAAEYNELFSGVPEIKTQKFSIETPHSHHIYPVYLDTDFTSTTRRDLREYLSTKGVQTSIHYRPIHQMPLVKENVNLKNTDYLGARILSLPLHDGLSKEDIQKIFFTITNYIKEVK